VNFDELWTRYQKPLTYYVRNLTRGCVGHGDEGTDPEDLVQEIMIKVWRRSGRLDRRLGVTSWVYRVARNHCIDIHRRNARRAVRRLAGSNTNEELGWASWPR
jgi:RNA polymerase sigma factor (sigma-70 family)